MEIWDISPDCKHPHCRYLLWSNYVTPFIVKGKNCPILAISLQMRDITPCKCLFLPLSSKGHLAYKLTWGSLHYRYLHFVNSVLFFSVRSVRIEENAPSERPHSICTNCSFCDARLGQEWSRSFWVWGKTENSSVMGRTVRAGSAAQEGTEQDWKI